MNNIKYRITKSCIDFKAIIPFLKSINIIPKGIVIDVQSEGLTLGLANRLDRIGVDSININELCAIPMGWRIRYTNMAKGYRPWNNSSLRTGEPKGVICQLEKLQACYKIIKEGTYPIFANEMVEVYVNLFEPTDVLSAARVKTICLLDILEKYKLDKRVILKKPRKNDPEFDNYFWAIEWSLIKEIYPRDIIMWESKERRLNKNNLECQFDQLDQLQ